MKKIILCLSAVIMFAFMACEKDSNSSDAHSGATDTVAPEPEPIINSTILYCGDTLYGVGTIGAFMLHEEWTTQNMLVIGLAENEYSFNEVRVMLQAPYGTGFYEFHQGESFLQMWSNGPNKRAYSGHINITKFDLDNMLISFSVYGEMQGGGTIEFNVTDAPFGEY